MSKTINIRGTLFEVDVETLGKMSYFKLSWETLILGFESKVINRCPDSFRHILDLLGYGIIDESLGNKDPFMLKKIHLDIEFYGVNVDVCSSTKNSIDIKKNFQDFIDTK